MGAGAEPCSGRTRAVFLWVTGRRARGIGAREEDFSRQRWDWSQVPRAGLSDTSEGTMAVPVTMAASHIYPKPCGLLLVLGSGIGTAQWDSEVQMLPWPGRRGRRCPQAAVVRLALLPSLPLSTCPRKPHAPEARWARFRETGPEPLPEPRGSDISPQLRTEATHASLRGISDSGVPV